MRRSMFDDPRRPSTELRGGKSEMRQAGRSDLVDVAAQLKGETEKAWRIDDGATIAWLPKSEVEYDGEGIFTMPEWLAKAKGLI